MDLKPLDSKTVSKISQEITEKLGKISEEITEKLGKISQITEKLSND
jgi:hypothetical protein